MINFLHLKALWQGLLALLLFEIPWDEKTFLSHLAISNVKNIDTAKKSLE